MRLLLVTLLCISAVVAASALKCYTYSGTAESFNDKINDKTLNATVCGSGVKSCIKYTYDMAKKGTTQPCSLGGTIQTGCGPDPDPWGTPKAGCVSVKEDSDAASACSDKYPDQSTVEAALCIASLTTQQLAW